LDEWIEGTRMMLMNVLMGRENGAAGKPLYSLALRKLITGEQETNAARRCL